MTQMPTAVLKPECQKQALTKSVTWYRRGYGSLALLMLFVGVGPCQAQVVMESATHEEDEGAGAGELFKKALQANAQRKGLAASVREFRANAVEDAARGLTAPFGKIVTESSVEELSGEVAGVQENADHQKVEVLPVVEMESSMSEEDSPVQFVWGRPQADLRELTNNVADTTTTETSTTPPTAAGSAPAPSPDIYTSKVTYTGTMSTPDQAALDATCDAFRTTVADRNGVDFADTTCEATYRDADGTILVEVSTGGRRRLTDQGTVQFDITIITQSVEEASRITTELGETDAAEITAAVQTEIQNDPDLPDAVKTIAQTVDVDVVNDVVTERSEQTRAMRGGLTVTVGNTGYTNQQIIEFVTEMLVQALADTDDTNVNADNITVSVDSNTSVRFTIRSYEAIEDVAILDALSQSDTATVLQTILTDASVDITIDGVTVDWEVFGTLTIVSNAADAADQQKLTNASVFSIPSMMSSLSTYAQTQFNLASLEVGVFLWDTTAFQEGVATSNRIVVTYSYVPATFAEYCDIATQQNSASQQLAMEAALSYTGVDATIQPAFASFEQDPVLAACLGPGPDPTGSDGTATATAVIVLIAVGVVLCVLGILLAAYCALRRRRTEDASGPLTSDDQEAQRHGTVPESSIQVTLPPADQSGTADQSAEAPESDVHRERGAERHWNPNRWHAEEQFLEYIDDEPGVEAV